MTPDSPDPALNSAENLTGALTRFSLHRRVTILVMLLTIIVVGGIAASRIPLELVPRGFEANSLEVWIPWRSAPVEETLEKITLPAEEELSTVRGLSSVNSWTSRNGASLVVSFQRGTDMDVAYRELRDRVERAKTRLPDDVDRTFIYKHESSGFPVLFVGVVVDPELLDPYDLIQKQIVQPLARIDGVATVNTDGLMQKEVIIEIDKERAEAHGLNIYQLAQELRGDNFSMSSGSVRESGGKFLLRSLARYESLEQLEERPINALVRLKDIAAVRYQEPDQRFMVRVNGKPAVGVAIRKEAEANTVDVCAKIAAAVEEMKKNPRLTALELEVVFNQGSAIKESLGNLVASGRIGAVFAALVLFVFLRRFRLTLIITLSIPLSLLMALTVIHFSGETLNMLSLLGLVICVGLLVDNSVVVAENIHRLYRDGVEPKTACIRGAGEIALAITLATLTTVVVFLPAALVEGDGQFFLIRLALPICVSLVASLFVALAFIPLSVYLTTPRGGEAVYHGEGWRPKFNAVLRRGYEATFGKLNSLYTKALGVTLRHRFDLVMFLFVLFAASGIVGKQKIKILPYQEEDAMSFNIFVGLSSEYSFEDGIAYLESAEKVIQEKQNEYGLRGFLIVAGPWGGRIEGWLDSESEVALTAKEIGERLLKDLPLKPGIKLNFGKESRGAEDPKGDTFTFLLTAEDHRKIDDVAAELRPILESIEGVLRPRQNEHPPPNELALVIDRERASAAGVDPSMVAGIVGYALRGAMLPKFYWEGREIPVRVRFEEQDRQSLADLGGFMAPAGPSNVVSIASITTSQPLKAPKGLFRRDKRATEQITVELEKETAPETIARLAAFQESVALPEGVRITTMGQTFNTEELDNLKFAAMMSILFIYLLMGFLFESFILPLSILLTIPLAAVGVIWIHVFTGKNLDFLGIVGTILLIGVVVNNGIVLIDYVNRLRNQGMKRADALLRAADRRFRPIVMTALTTIIGMIPLAVSEPSQIGLSYKSFGLTLIGGMTTATLLTLLVTPVFYTFFDDARHILMDRLRALRQGRKLTTLP